MADEGPNVCEFCRASNDPDEDVCLNCGGPLGESPGGEAAAPALERRRVDAPTHRRWIDIVDHVLAVAVGAVGVWLLFALGSTDGLVLEGGSGGVILVFAIAAVAVGAYGVRGLARDIRQRQT